MRALVFPWLAVPTLAGQVWIVDAALGPGAQHREIGPALQGAVDGDVILVRSGHYAPFAIGPKSIVIAADAQAVVEVDGPLRVTQPSSVAKLLVQGLRFTSGPGQKPSALETCMGQVRLERCAFVNENFGFGAAPDGVQVQNSACVVFTACVARAAQASGASGGHGLSMGSSIVHAYSCDFAAADLGPGLTTAGGAGVRVLSGEFHAFDTSLRGGKGSDAIWMNLPQLPPICQVPGDGGNGLLAVTASASAALHACDIAGGASGAPNGTCTGGTPGAPVGSGAGAVALSSGPQHAYAATSPLRGGEQLGLLLQGAPAELALVACAALPSAPLELGLTGPLWLAAPWVLMPIGILDATGSASASVVVADPGAGGSGIAVPSQAVFVSGTTASALLGPTASVVLLDSNVP